MEVVIVGVKRSEYKKDGSTRVAFNYCAIKQFTRYEQENADCEGEDVIREFSSTDFNIHPGDRVEFIYEPGYQDKATLVDVRILELSDKPPFEEPENKKEKPVEKAAGK